MMKLPEDIVIQVLTRLPAKSLLRFKCVSKFWNSTIRDPRFAKSHSQLSNSTQSQKLIISKSLIYTINLHTCQFDDNSSVIPWDYNEISKIIDTCNGLICATLEDGKFVILNPTTRESRCLPQPPCGANEYFSVDINGKLHGFGYDDVSDDYKVIKSERLVPRGGAESEKSHFMVSVFSLKSNCWRRIPDSPDIADMVCEGTYVDGRIYWIPSLTSGCLSIESFSTNNEKFETTSLPVDREVVDDYELGKFNGRPCVSLTREDGVVQVWTLMNTDDESIDCWTPLLEWRFAHRRPSSIYERPTFLFCTPLARTSGGGILVRFTRNWRTQLLVFNPMVSDNSFTPIHVPGNPDISFSDFVSTFVESLTSPFPLGN